MKTIQTKVFEYNELSDEAKEKARNWFREGNLDYEWWDSTYEDAKNAGLEITNFDLDRNRHAKGNFIQGAEFCANQIIKGHGQLCETYKTAKAFLDDRDKLVEKHSDGFNKEVVADDNEYEFDKECDELGEEFLRSILEDYSIILQHECEYLQSDEAVEESIKANGYTFTEDGKRFG